MKNHSDSEVVVSGISGRFPNARNMQEFSYKLYNKVDSLIYWASAVKLQKIYSV